MKCMVEEAKSPVKNLLRQHCMEGFNSGINGLIMSKELTTDKSSYVQERDKHVLRSDSLDKCKWVSSNVGVCVLSASRK
jgi:hypothetical protein